MSIEDQNRGTIHAHMLIKLGDEPSYGKIEGLEKLGELLLDGFRAGEILQDDK